MTAPSPGPLEAEQKLQRARDEVLATVAGSAGSPQQLTLNAPGPLRPVSPELTTKLIARGGADPVKPRVTAASAVAVLDAILLVIALVTGHWVLAIVAGVLLVLLGGAALAARRATPGPRLNPAELRAIRVASRWRSEQAWSGPLVHTRERGLVVAAIRAVERIIASPGWRSGRLDEHRVRIDVAIELDQVDAQCFRVASARYEGETGGLPIERPADPVVEQAWDAVVTRVAALHCYADSLDGLGEARAQAVANPVRDADLLGGSFQDELATQNLAALTFFYTATLFDAGHAGTDL
ncbi:MAG TPA: hypothetical protein VGN18_14095 [Jatrophihabitans sp.]|uniref:hypothetical protein n=1 Tax=Jatrophihabitans sp. TaxID=1932789 RepID=UPI002DFBEF0C|nr:hypothetical protein [Jatrophihabitans sp.]